jgi:hypothetical protein
MSYLGQNHTAVIEAVYFTQLAATSRSGYALPIELGKWEYGFPIQKFEESRMVPSNCCI